MPNTCTRQQMDDLLKIVYDGAPKVLAMHGNHVPMMFLLTPEGVVQFDLAGPMGAFERLCSAGLNDVGQKVKDVMAHLMKAAIQQTQSSGFAFVTEAWVVRMRKEDMPVIGGDEPGKGSYVLPPARDHPKRSEALIVHWEFRLDSGRVSGMRSWPYRHEGEKIIVDPPEDVSFDGKDPAEGRFVNLLE